MQLETYSLSVQSAIRSAAKLAGDQGLKEFGPDHILSAVLDSHWVAALAETGNNIGNLMNRIGLMFPTVGEQLEINEVLPSSAAIRIFDNLDRISGSRRMRNLIELLFDDSTFVKPFLTASGIELKNVGRSFGRIGLAELAHIGQWESDDADPLHDLANESADNVSAMRAEISQGLASTNDGERILALRTLQARLGNLATAVLTDHPAIGSLQNESSVTPSTLSFSEALQSNANELLGEIIGRLHELVDSDDASDDLKAALDELISLLNEAIRLISVEAASPADFESNKTRVLDLLSQVQGVFSFGRKLFKSGADISTDLAKYGAGYAAFGEVSGLYSTPVSQLIVQCVTG
ncbi:MAG: hypothetical protein HQ477_08550 [Chloroflexi bacterium]|nr:hypothetical protein [Chloroflexota bacterium]